jgi:hypothetical protein
MVTCHHHRGGARVDDIRKLTGNIEMKKRLIAIAFSAVPFSAQADIWKSIILAKKVSAGPDVDYVEMYQYHPSENLCERQSLTSQMLATCLSRNSAASWRNEIKNIREPLINS